MIIWYVGIIFCLMVFLSLVLASKDMIGVILKIIFVIMAAWSFDILLSAFQTAVPNPIQNHKLSYRTIENV